MQTIITKYHGPTTHRPPRIIARTGGGFYQKSATSVVKSYDYGMEAADNHRKAAEELFRSLQWGGEMVGGETSAGYTWVFTCGPKISLQDND